MGCKIWVFLAKDRLLLLLSEKERREVLDYSIVV